VVVVIVIPSSWVSIGGAIVAVVRGDNNQQSMRDLDEAFEKILSSAL
jgi:hypothetical protein